MAVKFFKSRQELHDWLLKYHEKKTELWVGYYKKKSAKTSLNNAEVLDEMLCFGWIDGIRKSIDEESYCNRYTPRTARSKWSKINTNHIKRLMKEKRMMPAGRWIKRIVEMLSNREVFHV